MRWKLAVFIIVIVLAASGVLYLVSRWEGEAPIVTFPDGATSFGKPRSWSFTIEDSKTGLREVTVLIRREAVERELARQEYPRGGVFGGGKVRRKDLTVLVDPKALGLADGKAVIVVSARDWSLKGNTVVRELPVTLDTVPPKIEVRPGENNVNQGGTGLVVFRVGEPAEATGVQVGDLFFPGYPAKPGSDRDYLCFFVIPPEAPEAVRPMIVARDLAGNETTAFFPLTIHPKVFRHDAIDLTDSFLSSKMPEFASSDPSLGSDPVKIFLTVNRDWRTRDHARLGEMLATGRSDRLWSGVFTQMRNTKNMAGYADRRTYRYQGREIDQQTHLGLDLASTAGAPVPAANAGAVVFADDLGIYGKTVIVDHGQGLFTGYSHLAAIGVTPGQMVKQGEALGNSGQTGMAGGDHLHFSVLISGVFASPLEWIDQHWIADNVTAKLQ